MATPGVNLDALENLQAEELRKLIEILQGLAAPRTKGALTPKALRHPHTPTTAAGEVEAILWEKIVTGIVLLPDRPPTRTPPPPRADS